MQTDHLQFLFLPSCQKTLIIFGGHTRKIMLHTSFRCFLLSCKLSKMSHREKWGKVELFVGGGGVPSWRQHHSKPLISGN